MGSACWACELPECICADIDALPSTIEILVVRHFVERHKVSGSARLIPLATSGARILDVGGPGDTPRTELGGTAAEGTYLLFPGGRDVGTVSPPIKRLIVPDGTWAQARRMRTRIPLLSQLPTVAVSAAAPPTKTLRAARERGELPTAVAVAGALEATGNGDAAELLLELYGRLVELLTRPSRGPR